jgi:pimeloyl-ACP methyl ester carboxylesterase
MIKRLFSVLVAWRILGPRVGPGFSAGQEHPMRVPARTVFVGDREFLVRQMGSGPDLVLIHGLNGSSLAEWYKMAPRLADRFRVTLVDHRNHGLSAGTAGRFDVEDVADDVAAVLARVGIESADLVGYSMGGTIAQAIAHRHPGVVRRLVLVATMAVHPTTYRVARQVFAMLTRGWERLTGIGTPEVRAGYLVLTGAVERRHARWVWEENQRRDPEMGAAAALALLRFDSTPWIGKVTAPTLVVIPTRDQLVPTAWQYRLAGLLPKGEVAEVEGARHEVPWTHPDLLAERIEAFLG